MSAAFPAMPAERGAELLDRHRVILCDIWGCIHDGVSVFPGVESALRRWRREGRIVLLLTNAPRTAQAVGKQLDTLGLDAAAYDGILTSGDTGIAALREAGKDEVGFIGTAMDRAILTAAGVRVRDGPDGDTIVCTGLEEARPDPAGYDDILADMLARGAWLLCFNPDRVVVRGNATEPCAGAIAERYEAMGGRVGWFGKPYAPVYQRALAIASERLGRRVVKTEVVAIGDGLATDYLGAAQAGFDFIFVSHGIEAAAVDSDGIDAVLERFSEQHGRALPPPLAVAPRLTSIQAKELGG